MVLVTGYGMITSLGHSVEANKTGLFTGKQTLHPPEILKTKHKNLPIGEIKLTNDILAKKLGVKSKKYNRSTLFGLFALNEAIQYLSLKDLKNKKIAFINATTVGGMNEIERQYPILISQKKDSALLKTAAESDCAECTQAIASYFKLSGFQATISTACSSSANALLMGIRIIQNGAADIAICGGTDALSAFTLNGFNSLRNIDKELCRPFDQNRNGLNLGEGAAYLLLESESSATERKAEVLARVSGFSNTNEAYHPTAPSPNGEGALRTMKAALENAGLSAKDIDYVNAHGTATLGNDLSEGTAIQTLFGVHHHPPFSSIKAFTGHTLAASGAVAAIISCLCLKYQFVPPNLRFENKMDELAIQPQTLLLKNRALKYVLTNSFGFGGSNVSIIFGKA